ncbi:TKL protein kinase [Aphanomyces invadans]|uniref:TKL protein kinase n=1 Tax=Aphanomyces invadans TaxID=157072 RepID=A0A024TZZ1_9STRA|nr:TKL protein kinase [Aphanomyces invadans]ETV99740.1 TKL protein kinase [Aphanomyces invadans]|eukprot:XP_008871516.1 TKL protein kinase [Aphanomyces invadans]
MAAFDCDAAFSSIRTSANFEVYQPCAYLKTLWDKKVNSTQMQREDCTNPDCQQFINSHEITFGLSNTVCSIVDVATGKSVDMRAFGSMCGTVRATVRPMATSGQAVPATSSSPVVPGSTGTPTSVGSSSSTVVVVVIVAGVIVVLLVGAMLWRHHKRSSQTKLDTGGFVMLEEEPSAANTAVDHACSAKQIKASTMASSSSSTAHSTTLLSEAGVEFGPLALYQVRRMDLIIDGSLQHRGRTFDVRRANYMGRAVALKTCRDIQHIHAFVSEMKLLSTLDCPYIVQFVGVWWGKFAADLTLVTEYMDGGNLQDALLRASNQQLPQQKLSWGTKLSIALDVVDALVYLHSLETKVLHRNLSSHHVLLKSGDAHQPLVAKLQGFYHAREIQFDGMTVTAGVGAQLYTAPEVLQDGHYDDSADLFSYGVLLSELCTEKPPYHDLCTPSGKPLSEAALLSGIMAGSLQPAFALDCPPWFVQLGRDCMAVDPAVRPSAAKVSYRLNQWIG